MQMNTIKIIKGIIAVFIFATSCKVNFQPSAQTENSENHINTAKCTLYTDSLQLGKEIFTPFEKVFIDFENSRLDFDLIIQEIGQNTNLIRMYEKNKGVFIMTKYDGSGVQKTVVNDFKSPSKIENNQISQVYICNEGSSDLGTYIYALKIKGEYVIKLWFENGDFDDLDTNSRQKINEFIEMIKEVRKKSIDP